MKSKLGVYVISAGATDVLEYISKARPSIVVSMDHNPDLWAAVKRASPETFIVGRFYIDDGEQVFDDPENNAQAFFNRMRPDVERMRPYYSAWMGYNESVIKTPDEARTLSRFYVKWGALMRSINVPSASYSFSTGSPEIDLWQYLVDGIRACDYLSLHEYSAPHMSTGVTWLCLRYRRVYDLLPIDARKPLLITETGIDGGSDGNPQWGWRQYMNESQYVNELRWYDSELKRDSYVKGATIFALAGWGYKGSFSIVDANAVRDYIATDDGTPSTNPPIIEPTVPPVVVPPVVIVPPVVVPPKEEIPPVPINPTVPQNAHLASFPRPVNDNGRGIHFILDSRQPYVEQYAPYLKQMKMSWATVYGGDEAQCIRVAKYLKDTAGVFSVMRVYASGEKPKTPDFWMKFAQQAKATGLAPYIQIFNEPEDGREGFDSPDHFAQMWGQRAEAVVAGGGYPGLQVLAEEFVEAACKNMSPAVKAKMFFVLHNYGANHPPIYPYPNKTAVEDDTTILRFLAFEEWFKKYLGLVPPMIGGEGGWLFRNHDDTTMGEVDIEKWIAWHYEMYEWFRKGVISNGQPLPDYLFSSHPWLLWAGNWYSDSWLFGLHSDADHADVNSKAGVYKSDLIKKLTEDAPYVRQFGGGATVPPVVTPPTTGTDNAKFQTSLFPAEMWVGRKELIGIVVKNTGTTTWEKMKYGLYFNVPNSDIVTYTAVTQDVAPNQEYTFNVEVSCNKEGVFDIPFRMSKNGNGQPFGDAYKITVVFKREPTPQPALIDPRCSWISVKQGNQYQVKGIYFYDSKPVDDPESEGGIQIRVGVVDVSGKPVWGVPVKQAWPDGSSTHVTRFGLATFDMSGDSNFDPNKGQKGVYNITVGDCLITGFGLPLRQHVEYGVDIVKTV